MLFHESARFAEELESVSDSDAGSHFWGEAQPKLLSFRRSKAITRSGVLLTTVAAAGGCSRCPRQ